MATKKASNRVNMIDKTYNSWKVLEHSYTKGKIAYYKCECLECNTEHVVDGRNIRSGLSKRCTVCGLKHSAQNQVGKEKTKKTPKQVAEYYLKNRMKKQRPKGKIKKWEISDELFISLIYDNCFYCGISPSTKTNPTKGHQLAASRADDCFITYNGIDRIDSSKGYVAGNVVTCCEQCNRAKLDYSVEEFKSWLKRAYHHMFKG